MKKKNKLPFFKTMHSKNNWYIPLEQGTKETNWSKQKKGNKKENEY